ncbi:alpha/beta-hydrolase [Aspergillus heteromorphus CBS 117.55]|uniref:Alpha/beta-hydrolase n=1 Tax=Aspergillus heteromorphus CBS 117.55 TaxID=1448321 RepID=A0A317VGK5_9EURO|nr:alpha/beta-hydrolase [Aspergillus heteromorphus CBS 117.55]PWY73055.1 alpha/beta-hydrolase [Aspergillus heteromorphus CBS 117.55]
MLAKLGISLLALVAPFTHGTYQRTYFYVGGNYTLDGNGEHIHSGQIYVEKLTPARVTQPHPIVFIHGQAQTGTNWLDKPDGQPGWASYFLDQGYECYLLDQPFRARSPWQSFNGALETYSAEHLQRYFTATQRYNLWPQASLHTQWPGSGVMHDPIFDAYYTSTVPFVGNDTVQEVAMQEAGVALLDKIGKPVFLLGHSQGGMMTWAVADQRPDLVHTIIAIEPKGPPFVEAMWGGGPARKYGLTDIPITYAPAVTDPETELIKTTVPSNSSDRFDCVVQADDPPPRQLASLSQIPVLLVTAEASYFAQYDWCIAGFLRQAGVQTEHIQLAEVGIHGNGHMMFLEKNSDGIAAFLHGRMEAYTQIRSDL